VISSEIRSSTTGVVRAPQTVTSPPSAHPRAISPSIERSAGGLTESTSPLAPEAAKISRDDMVVSPTTGASRAKPHRVAPEDDPNVRRDFEARIAAATAALNRTPSVSASLQRKNTKRTGLFKISSPTLVSSSATIGGTPLTPGDSPIESGVAKALEKASGSGSKMSMRWRKLGFKRGTSVSNTADIASLPASAQPMPVPRLEGPIALRDEPLPPKSVPAVASQNTSKSPDLNAFRFPTSATLLPTSSPVEIAKTASDRLGDNTQNLSDEPNSASLARVLHSPSSSGDTAVIKFIEAGRAVGLNDVQLNDMLIAKGMVDQTHPHSSPSLASTAPPAVATDISQQPSTDKKTAKGLFRSLSRKKSRPSGKAAESTEPVPRNIIVRRTILVPSEASPLASSGYINGQASPSSSLGATQRKLSVKRKPLNLTKEDHVLVQSSPTRRSRKESTATTSSGLSADHPRPEETVGLGFRYTEASLGPEQSSSSVNATDSVSESGSLYDIYDDYANQEAGASPLVPQEEALLDKRSTQAVEIT